MKKQYLASIIFFLLSALVFTSCKKGSEQGKLIPEEAAFVMVINGESMNQKLPFSEFKNGALFQEVYNDSTTDATVKTIMTDPSNTGIAIDKEIIMFVVKDDIGGYMGIEGTVKDAAKMKSFFNTTVKDAAESDKDNVHFVAKNNMTASWDKERFVLIMDLPEMNNMAGMYPPMSDSSQDKALTDRGFRDGTVTAGNVHKLEEKNSLAKNDSFSELMKSKGDLHFWFSGEKIQGDMIKSMGPLSMMNLSKLTDGSIASGVVNFEEGKIVMDIASYSNKELFALWKKYEGGKIDTDMMQRSPIKDVAAAFSMNYKPEVIKAFLKLTGLDGFANMGAGMTGFSVDEFVKAVGNDLFICIGDFRADSTGKPLPKGFFATSIADKVAFGKILAAGKKLGSGPSVPKDIYYNANDKYFAIGNDKSVVDNFVGGKQKNSLPFLDKIKGLPVGGYINFQYILLNTKSLKMDSAATAMHTASVGMWDNAYFTGGNVENNSIKQHVEINLMDKKMNSLKALNNYFNTMGVIAKKNETRFKEEFKRMDSSSYRSLEERSSETLPQ